MNVLQISQNAAILLAYALNLIKMTRNEAKSTGSTLTELFDKSSVMTG